MSHFKERFPIRLTQTLTEESSIHECVFEGFVWSGSGGGAYVDGKFKLSVSGSTFLACESGLNGGGLCVGTTESNSRRNTFVSCRCSQWGFGLFQASHTSNTHNLSSCLLCCYKEINGECYATIIQKNGLSMMKEVNGSHLSSVGRECGYHHHNGPSSHVIFLTFTSCSGPYVSSFHCIEVPMQVQENVCTINSSVKISVIVLYTGLHSGKNFIVTETKQFIARDRIHSGSINFHESIFGGSPITASWLATTDCSFSYDRELLNQKFGDRLICFHQATSLFTLTDFGTRLVSIIVYSVSILVITM